jgi:3-deoxy-D-arabino-heptulosonate 7-phosphate (DAHP) synthase class II
LNPENTPGKLTIITRYGQGKVLSHLPQLIEQLHGLNVLYQCDPMHGNTVVLETGKKTRFVDAIKAEIAEVISAHRTMGSRVHGLHLEATGDDVTECMGVDVSDFSLPRYRSVCDPRLNPMQTRHVVDFFHDLSAKSSPKAVLPLSPCLASRLTTAETSQSENSTSSSDEDMARATRW